MRIESIIKSENNIYVVEFRPNWFEKLFGIKAKVERFKDTGDTYTYGGGRCYINEKGFRIGNNNRIQKAIDASRQKF